jgi:S1-C subfamily serine protease
VTLRMVVTTRVVVSGREMNKEEHRVETTATVIDPSGLAALSLSTTDPGDTLERIMPKMGGGGPQVNFETTPTDLRFRFADGREVPARIVLQDKDLDIAFARPTEKLPAPVAALNLADAASPKMLDEIVVLSRLGRVGTWAASATLDRLRAVIERPRVFFVPSAAAADAMGTPVFALDSGKVVGILLLRVMTTDGLPVILPARDVTELAEQARRAQ